MNLRVFDERNGAFGRLRNERVLIYWPHGLGDFVHFGYVVPLLEPSNTYFLTRFGDDFVHLYDGAHGIAPIYSGVNAIGDGSAQGMRHLGIDWKRICNRDMKVTIEGTFASRCRDAGITALLYTDYPEYEGKLAFPFHTKARALIRNLVDPQRLHAIDMTLPLANALSFEAPIETKARIENRLREFIETGQRLYLIAPGGHTNAAKTWPISHVEAFEMELRTFDPVGRSLVVDEATLRARFGDLDVPFAHLLATLLRASYAFVGAAAGPLHAALAMCEVPCVGIWLAHHPDWYDEPNARSIHLTGPTISAKRYDLRKATTTKPVELRARTISFRDRIPGAADVFEALELLR